MLGQAPSDSSGIDWASTIALVAAVLYLLEVAWRLSRGAQRRLRGKVAPVGRKYGLLFLRLALLALLIMLILSSQPTRLQVGLAIALVLLGGTDFIVSFRERRKAVQAQGQSVADKIDKLEAEVLAILNKRQSTSATKPIAVARRRRMSELTNDELHEMTLSVSNTLFQMVSGAQVLPLVRKRTVASYRSLASVNVQAVAEELDRRGYGRPGLSQLAKDAKSLEEIGWIAQHLAIASNQVPVSAPPKPPVMDVLRIAQQFTTTSKAIYAFLSERAMRSDEPKVVAEYREKFDATVFNLCLDLISAGLSDTERLKVAMTPPTSVHDIQWVARLLALVGEGFGPRLKGFMQKTGGGTLVRTKRTDEGQFPRIESAVDSFGHEPEELATALWIADGTGHELTPGDEVTFKVRLSDPEGDDVFVSIVPPKGLDDDTNVPISPDGTMTWIVREEDVLDPAYVFIFARSQRDFHRDSRGIDDSVGFVYRVVPRA